MQLDETTLVVRARPRLSEAKGGYLLTPSRRAPKPPLIALSVGVRPVQRLPVLALGVHGPCRAKGVCQENPGDRSFNPKHAEQICLSQNSRIAKVAQKQEKNVELSHIQNNNECMFSPAP
jgi:hypothetical protein